MALIQSLMETNLVTAGPADTVASVARAMAERGLGAVLVVDNGVLQGIFSERDLVNRVVGGGRDAAVTAVKEVMTARPVTVSRETHIKDAARLIREHNFRHLPVVEAGGRPVGMISTRVFLRFVSDGLERFIDEALYKKNLQEDADPYDYLGGSYAS